MTDLIIEEDYFDFDAFPKINPKENWYGYYLESPTDWNWEVMVHLSDIKLHKCLLYRQILESRFKTVVNDSNWRGLSCFSIPSAESIIVIGFLTKINRNGETYLFFPDRYKYIIDSLKNIIRVDKDNSFHHKFKFLYAKCFLKDMWFYEDD